MGRYLLKEVKNVYRFAGTEEIELGEYDFGYSSPEFCLLWKDGRKINSKFIRELLKIKQDIEKQDKQRQKDLLKGRKTKLKRGKK